MKRKLKLDFLLVAALFILSGVAGLIYQVVWFKHLSYFLGNTTYSQAIVLATFMGGLAIGAWWWGKKADESKNALKLFAWLEIGIAVYCFLYMPIFEGVKAGFIALVKSQGWASDSGIVLSLKFIVSILTMLVPTILMGGTLPVLVKYLSDRISDVGKNVSILYFINSLGAVIGTVLAGFYLLQTIGLKATVYVGASMDLLVGLFFLGFIYLYKKQLPTVPKTEKKLPKKEVKPTFTVTPRQYKLVVLIAAISGLCAMIYEVVWLRLLIPILSSTTYSFTIILTAFITGITLGSLLVYFLLPRLKNGFTFLGYCQLGVVISILLTLPFYEKIPYLIWSIIGDNMKTEAGYSKYLTTQFYYAFTIMIIPTIFMGMSLPIASRIAVRKVKESGQKVGNIFAINTVGTVVGSLLAGLLLIPTIGIKSTIEVALVLNLVLAVFVFLTPKVVKARTKIILLVITVLSAGYYYQKVDQEKWAYSIMMSEIPRKVNRKKPPKTYDDFFNSEQKKHDSVLFYEEGVGGTIVVGKKGDAVYLFTNGKGDAHSITDLRTQAMLGKIPILLHPKPDTALVIGFGAGTTIGSVLKQSRVEYAEVAEISGEVLDASRFFNHVNYEPLTDERLTVIRDDGLAALRLSKRKYDVIISQPSNPWSAGVGNLFTKEFFKDCKSKLREGGYMAQWFNLYEMNDTSLKLILRTIKSEFDHISLWQIGQSDILILCSDKSFDFDLEQLKINYDANQSYMKNLGLTSLEVFLSLEFLKSDKTVEQYAGSGLENAEDLPLLEYWAPKSYFLNNSPDEFIELDARNKASKKKLLLNKHLDNNPISEEKALEIGLYHILYGSEKYGLSLGKINPKVYMLLSKELINQKKYREAQNYLDLALKVSDTISSVYQQKAILYEQMRNPKKALSEISNAIRVAPEVPDYYIQRSKLYLSLNAVNLAIEDLQKVITIDPTRIGSYIKLSDLYGAQNNYTSVLKTLNLAEEHIKNSPEIYFKRALALFLLNELDKSLDDIDKVISLNKDYGRAYFLAAQIYSKKKNKAKTCEYLAIAIQKGVKKAEPLFDRNCKNN